MRHRFLIAEGVGLFSPAAGFAKHFGHSTETRLGNLSHGLAEWPIVETQFGTPTLERDSKRNIRVYSFLKSCKLFAFVCVPLTKIEMST